MAKKTRPLKTFPSRGLMRHWHPVGLGIPRQVARLQSLTPLPQALVFYLAKDETQRTGDSREVTRSGFPRSFTSRARAGLRLHPGVRHGAWRRRRCEWEQPHIFHGAPLSRMMPNGCLGSPVIVLLFGLDRGFLMDVGPTRARNRRSS